MNIKQDAFTKTPKTFNEGDSPLVSIIVPVYKVENYLAECLESILNQSLKEIEVICVNDGSPDRCLEILNEYAAHDARVKVINQENAGASAARNTGILAATAPYLGFVDSDDKIEPQTYETALTLMQSDPEIDLVGWRFSRFTNNGLPFGNGSEGSKLEGPPFKLGPESPAKISLYIYTKLYKTAIIRENAISFINNIAEDSVFLLDYFPYSRKAVLIKDVFYHYRHHEQSITTKLNSQNGDSSFSWSGITVQKGFPSLVVLENVFDHYDKRGLLPQYKNALLDFFGLRALSNYSQLKPEQREHYWARLASFDQKYGLFNFAKIDSWRRRLDALCIKHPQLEKIFPIFWFGLKPLFKETIGPRKIIDILTVPLRWGAYALRKG